MGVDIDVRKRVCDLGIAYQQIVEILKAVSKKSEFIIMDEPTAPLTVKETAVFFKIIQKLKQDHVTIIFISHRLASAKMADRILVLSKGQIQEEGSHAELMERGGIYADMYRMQSSWYENHGSERECDEENRKYI